MARPRKTPQTGEGGEGTQTTGSSGNARRPQKRTLGVRIGAMERQLAQQNQLLHRIARGVSS